MRPLTSVSAITGKLWFWPTLVAVLAIVLIVPGLGSHGFWEPHEIVIADRAQELAAKAAPEDVPAEVADDENVPAEVADDEDVPAEVADDEVAPDEALELAGVNERAAATGIGALGLSERAARAPMALFGLVAFAATLALAWRLAGARAGVFAGIALLSFPLFAFPSRLLVGDIATVAAHALIILGAAGLCWPRHPRRGLRRLVYLADGAAIAIGIALGHAAAGTLLGVLAPLAAAALAGWLAVLGEGRAHRAGPGAASTHRVALVGGTMFVSAAAACAALWIVGDAYDLAPAHPGDRAIFGFTLLPQAGELRALGGAWLAAPDPDATFDGLFEMLAYGLFPWSALAPLALIVPALARGTGRRAWGAYLVLAWAAGTWATAVFLQRTVGPVHFPALAAVAVALGTFLDDILRARDRARDGDEQPGVSTALPLAAVFTLLAAAVLAKDLLAFPDEIAGVHLAGTSVELPNALRGWVVALVGLGLLTALALTLGLHGWKPRAGSWLALARWPVRHSVHVAMAVAVVYAGFLAHGWIPALAGQYSSKGLFDALADQRAPDERLVILGSPGPGHELYARGELETVASRHELVELFAAPERSFGLIRRSRLCPLQQTAAREDTDYYVIYDGNADFLLLSNQLGEGQPDLNPLSRLLLRDRPDSIGEPIDATFDDRIRLIGFDMPERVSRGESFEMTLLFEVLAPISRNWKVLVHVDRGSSRFNGDHEPAEGVCGTRYWQAGDIVVDTFKLTAGGAGHPRGDHEVWTGFFVGSRGSWTNMEVSNAPDVDETDRVKLGTIRVE